MIILDPSDDETSKNVTNFARAGPSAAVSSEEEPAPPPYTPRTTDPLLFPPQGKRYNAQRRFVQALSVALFVLLLGAALVGSFVVSWQTRWEGPLIPGNPNITGCISVPQWDNHKGSQPHDPTFKAAIDLHLPADTDAVTLQSFGTLSSGVVYISADPEWDLPAISFQVVASHTSQRILEEVFVCRRVENGHHTVSIHAPSYAEGHEGAEPVDFTSALTFPSVSAIKNVFPDVSTDMPSFEHVIRTVSGKVRFGHISLNTSDQPVTVDRLVAERIDITTSNAAIRGTFDVSASLNLHTSNGAIDVSADLASSNGSSKNTNMTLTASQGSISSVVRLHSSSWHGTGGSFDVIADGSNTPVNISVALAPLNSFLVLDARGSGAPAHVSLHPAFEGVYQVESERQHAAAVVVAKDAVDPSGAGRERRVQGLNWREQRISGFVGWGERMRNQPYGAVKVVSSEQATLVM